MITIVLIIVFFTMLLLKPTYCLLHEQDTQIIKGCKMPYASTLILRLHDPDCILIINYKTFKAFWEQVEKNNLPY